MGFRLPADVSRREPFHARRTDRSVDRGRDRDPVAAPVISIIALAMQPAPDVWRI